VKSLGFFFEILSVHGYYTYIYTSHYYGEILQFLWFSRGFSIATMAGQGTAAVSAGMRPLLFTATAAILGTSKERCSKG
jgi:hypothetical protein